MRPLLAARQALHALPAHRRVVQARRDAAEAHEDLAATVLAAEDSERRAVAHRQRAQHLQDRCDALEIEVQRLRATRHTLLHHLADAAAELEASTWRGAERHLREQAS